MQYPIQFPVYHSHFTNTLEFKVSFSVFSHNKKSDIQRIRLTVVPSVRCQHLQPPQHPHRTDVLDHHAKGQE